VQTETCIICKENFETFEFLVLSKKFMKILKKTEHLKPVRWDFVLKNKTIPSKMLRWTA
jgi:hypothetical protein